MFLPRGCSGDRLVLSWGAKGEDVMPFLIFQSLGPAELLIILAIVVVLFGATRIGEIGKGVGRGIREFRRELREGQEEMVEKKEPAKASEAGEEQKSYAAKAETSEDKKKHVQH